MKNFGRFKNIFGVIFAALILVIAAGKISAQENVDKIVATVNDTISKTELITYSDLMWQLALEPDAPLQPPTSDDLNRTLQLLINQRLFALEAERVPRAAPTDDEVKAEIKRIRALFPSDAALENRLRIVGFTSVSDDNFRRIMEQRVAIEKYLDFRFRSFVVITPDDENKYYRDVFVPDFRRRNPGLLVPASDDVRGQINRILTEEKVSLDIEKFLDDAKRRAEIIVLSEV